MCDIKIGTEFVYKTGCCIWVDEGRVNTPTFYVYEES